MSLIQANARSKSLPRTFAIAGVVLVHVAVFYALTAGRHSINIVKTLSESTAVFIPLEKPPEPAPKLAPKKIELDKAVPAPEPVEAPPIVPDIPVETSAGETAITTDSSAQDSAPVQANSFSITHRVDPSYPSASRRAGEQGTVLISITMDAGGKPLDVSVAKSSGFPALDEAAVSAVRRWRFATNVTGQSHVTVPITFKLQTEG